jgi:transposase-like protein
MNVTDSSDQQYVCDICGETFQSERALNRHVHEVGLVD